jgi:hypothetical protein
MKTVTIGLEDDSPSLFSGGGFAAVSGMSYFLNYRRSVEYFY